MRPKRLYEDRNLDLNELWKQVGGNPPGPISNLPPERKPDRRDSDRSEKSR
jgi:hypothetical protein